MKIKVLIAFLLGAVLAGTGWMHAQQKTALVALTPQDDMEIRQLYAKYSWATDVDKDDDGSKYASVFTADGEFRVSGRSSGLTGSAALAASNRTRFVTLKKDGWESRHVISNLVLEPVEGGVKGSAYATVFDVASRGYTRSNNPAGAKPPVVNHTGTYDDLLVKTRQGWRFKRRVFTLDAGSR